MSSFISDINYFYMSTSFRRVFDGFVGLCALFFIKMAIFYILYNIIGYAVNKILRVISGGGLDV